MVLVMRYSKALGVGCKANDSGCNRRGVRGFPAVTRLTDQYCMQEALPSMTSRHADNPRHFDPVMLLSQVCCTPVLPRPDRNDYCPLFPGLPKHIYGLPASEFHAVWPIVALISQVTTDMSFLSSTGLPYLARHRADAKPMSRQQLHIICQDVLQGQQNRVRQPTTMA